MASFGQENIIRSKVHHNRDLCRLILTAASASHPLEIRESNIPNAGSGLFTTAAIPAGVEIFRSSPIINVRDPSARHVCDWCYTTTPSGIDNLGVMAAEQLGATFLMPPKPTAMLLCSGCKVGRYCSQTCQRNAWKSFHKLECKAVLSEAPTMGPTTLAMYRLLLLKKDGRFTEMQWKALMQLESHFEEQHEDLRNDILAKVHDWGRKMGTEVDFMTVWELLCIIFTNSMNIRPAEADVSLGTSLDLVVSMINHDCSPNAHVFFEGSQTRVRSLKAIAAGGEITVSYCDPRLDVLLRESILRQTQFFHCECMTCNREYNEHLEASGAATEKDAIRRCEVILDKQKTMLQVAGNCTSGFYSVFKSNEAAKTEMVSQFAAAVETMTKSGYGGNSWPAHIEPLPNIRMTLAGMFKASFSYVPALKYALAGCLMATRRCGPPFVQDLFELVRILVQTCNEPGDGMPFTVQNFPTKRELQMLTMGYMVILCKAVRLAFGADCRYALTVWAWVRSFMGAGAGGFPALGQTVFEEQFGKVQSKLTAWAEVDRLLVLGDRRELVATVVDVIKTFETCAVKPGIASPAGN
ncbi:uncharacterized protein PgNI_12400 [Pyricularia grisea]|uniref:Uncharacterized protein n=1 Tax=Pyricularia grisea TaxID=148305 RepID=A0A6P8AMC6_PYRGI|nr:uncharacterized protein PgNI_12400 [Pyricularia grisea]TLD03186.1 hypothetical protein PgNI_12400 [Pyricularia grisea]